MRYIAYKSNSKHHEPYVERHMPYDYDKPIRHEPSLHEDEEYSRDFAEVSRILTHPPASWEHAHTNNKSFMDIIDMEVQELRTAFSNSNYEGIIENLLHVSAYAVKTHHKMTCDRK